MEKAARRVSKFFGSVLVVLSIFLLMSTLLLINVNKQMDNLDIIVDETVDEFFGKFKQQLLELAPENNEFLEFLKQCELGEMPPEQCVFLQQDSIFDDQLQQNKDQIVEQIQDLYAPVRALFAFAMVFVLLAIVMFVVGVLLIFFGKKQRVRRTIRSVCLRVGASLMVFYIGFQLFVNYTVDTFSQITTPSVSDLPQLFFDFSATLVLNMLQPAVRPLVMPTLVISLTCLIIFFVLIFTSGKDKKKEEIELLKFEEEEEKKEIKKKEYKKKRDKFVKKTKKKPTKKKKR